jgi:geranylgeranyl pyrophosphate synthase
MALAADQDPYKVFDELYGERVRPVIRQLFPISAINRGIHATLDAGANRFHAGLLILIGDLCGEAEASALGAAIAEYSWATLIVMDDVADRQTIRRGQPTLWRSDGISYAIHSVWDSSLSIVRVIADLEDCGICVPGTQRRYLSAVQLVLSGQARREKLRVTDSVLQFYRVMLAITSHLASMVDCFSKVRNLDFANRLRRSLRTLSYAASLKNDLEDVFPPSPHYSPGGSDLRACQPTYVLRAFYERMSLLERNLIDDILHSRLTNDKIVDEAIKLMQSNTLVARRLVNELEFAVKKAERELESAISALPDLSKYSRAAQLLRAWVRSHQALGNSRIAVRMAGRSECR